MEVAHRGPDDCGTFVSTDHRCVLAHTRLSILDLSPAGHQPMGLREQGAWSQSSSVSGHPSPVGAASARYWIVFNGEIYNYRQLRQELDRQALGVRGKALDSDREGLGGRRDRQGDVSREQGAGSKEPEIRCQRSEVAGHLSPVDGLPSSTETQATQLTPNASAEQGAWSEEQGPTISNAPSAIGESGWNSNSDTEVILRAYARWGRDCVTRCVGCSRSPFGMNKNRSFFLRVIRSVLNRFTTIKLTVCSFSLPRFARCWPADWCREN